MIPPLIMFPTSIVPGLGLNEPKEISILDQINILLPQLERVIRTIHAKDIEYNPPART